MRKQSPERALRELTGLAERYPDRFILVVDNILTRQRRAAWVSGAALGVIAGLQLLIGEEVLALVAILLVAQVVIMALLFPRHVLAKLPHAAIAFGTAAVVFIAIAVYPIWFQLFGPQHVSGDLHSGDRLVTDLWNLITPTAVQAVVPAEAKRITPRPPAGAAQRHNPPVSAGGAHRERGIRQLSRSPAQRRSTPGASRPDGPLCLAGGRLADGRHDPRR